MAKREIAHVEGAPEEGTPTTISVPDNEVAALANQLWIQRGSPIGSPEVDWFQAEEQLKNRKPLVAVGA